MARRFVCNASGGLTAPSCWMSNGRRIVRANGGAQFTIESPIVVIRAQLWIGVQRLKWAVDPQLLNVHGGIANSDDSARLFAGPGF